MKCNSRCYLKMNRTELQQLSTQHKITFKLSFRGVFIFAVVFFIMPQLLLSHKTQKKIFFFFSISSVSSDKRETWIKRRFLYKEIMSLVASFKFFWHKTLYKTYHHHECRLNVMLIWKLFRFPKKKFKLSNEFNSIRIWVYICLIWYEMWGFFNFFQKETFWYKSSKNPQINQILMMYVNHIESKFFMSHYYSWYVLRF